VTAEFNRPTARHHDQRGFGRAVKQTAVLRTQTGYRGDVYDRAARFALDHLRDRQPDQPQRRDDVDLEHLREHIVGHIQRRPLTDVGRAVVDQNVHRPEDLLGFAEQGLQLVGASDVTFDRMDFAGQRRELLRGRLEVLHLAAGDDDVGAGPGQTMRDCLADAAPPARDDGDFALQTCGCAHC
jgi:hypothetical protein